MSVKINPFSEPFEERVLSTFHRKGVVYVVQNRANGKCYVGQSVKTFAKRYGGMGMWWDFTTNRPLLNDLATYGTSSFVMKILEHSKTRSELNELEKRYAEQFNSYYPNGYNVRPCGEHKGLVTKHAHLEYVTQLVKLRNPEGQIIETTNIEALCEQYGLEKYQMWKVLKHEAKHHKRWTLADAPKAYRGGKRYVLYDITGDRYDVHCLRRFCDERNLSYSKMVSLSMGRVVASQGFALSVENFARQRKTA